MKKILLAGLVIVLVGVGIYEFISYSRVERLRELCFSNLDSQISRIRIELGFNNAPENEQAFVDDIKRNENLNFVVYQPGLVGAETGIVHSGDPISYSIVVSPALGVSGGKARSELEI